MLEASRESHRPVPRPTFPLLDPLLAALVAMATLAPGGTAQSRLAVELVPRVTTPVSAFGDQGPDASLGLTGMVLVRVFSPLSVYGGWDRVSFDCGQCSSRGNVRASGLFAGMEAQLSTDRRLRPWFRAGASRRTAESSIVAATIETEDTWAIHTAAGVLVAIGDRFAVTAGAQFETLDPGVDLGSDATELGTPMSYVSFGLGLRLDLIP